MGWGQNISPVEWGEVPRAGRWLGMAGGSRGDGSNDLG